MSQRVFRQNDLFRGGNNAGMNACVGDNGGPYDLYDYAYGYLEAASLLIKRAEKRDIIVDILVYPICYNFRHGLELYLKYGINCLLRMGKVNKSYQFSHSLLHNFKDFKASLGNVIHYKIDDMSFIEGVIICYDEVDPKGEIFRYPESIKGLQHLKDWSLINLDIVGAALSHSTEILKDWHYELEAELEAAGK